MNQQLMHDMEELKKSYHIVLAEIGRREKQEEQFRAFAEDQVSPLMFVQDQTSTNPIFQRQAMAEQARVSPITVLYMLY